MTCAARMGRVLNLPDLCQSFRRVFLCLKSSARRLGKNQPMTADEYSASLTGNSLTHLTAKQGCTECGFDTTRPITNICTDWLQTPVAGLGYQSLYHRTYSVAIQDTFNGHPAFFTGWMPFLSQPVVGLSEHRREKYHSPRTCSPQAHLGVFHPCL